MWDEQFAGSPKDRAISAHPRGIERREWIKKNQSSSIFCQNYLEREERRGWCISISSNVHRDVTRIHTTRIHTHNVHTHKRDFQKKKKLSIILPSNELNKRMIIRFVINYIYIFQYFNYLLNVNYIHIYKYIHICIIYIIIDIYIIYILYIHTLNARRMREREGCGDEGRLAESLARKREKKIEGEGHY